ncbi:MAG: translation initiation factor eIF-1A [Candidatus Micrarchaeota archaeon]|nr:translation initiation factor eIF-1A [Candidatus Micrarchaeota archaeon]
MGETNLNEQEEEAPIRLPKQGEILGLVVGLVGGGRLMVACKDGKERLCRIPGKIRRNIWVREGDVVIVVPWEVGGEKKGDIVWRYNKFQAEYLRKHGYIK